MTIDEAIERIRVEIERATRAGYTVHGWDDGTVWLLAIDPDDRLPTDHLVHDPYGAYANDTDHA